MWNFKKHNKRVNGTKRSRLADIENSWWAPGEGEGPHRDGSGRHRLSGVRQAIGREIGYRSILCNTVKTANIL